MGAITRRTVLAGAGAASLAALLAACSGASEGSASGTFRITDDLGNEIVLDAAPQRIVVSQWLLPAFWEAGIEPVGVLTFMPWDDIAAYAEAGVDRSKVTVLSESYGEVNLEALVDLDPELIICDSYAGAESLWGFADADMQAKAAAVAPIFAVSAETEAIEGIERRIEIAEAIGSDAAGTAATKVAFEEALAKIDAVAAAQSGLTVAVVGPSVDGLWVAPVADYADLILLQQHGITFFDAPEAELDTLSWELATEVSADVLLIDDRTTDEELATLAAENPTWNRIPAVAAGQAYATWRFALPYSYGALALSYEQLLPSIEGARPLAASA